MSGFAGAGRLLADDAADLGRSGEGDLVDILVLDECRSGFAVAGHDIEDARRQARLLRQFGEQKSRERGEFGGLQHDRAAERQRRRHFPGQHQEREVPRNDLTHHADWLIVGEFRFLKLGPAGMMIEMPRCQRYVEIACLAHRLAIVETFDDGEEPGMALDHARQRIEMARAPMTAEPGPARLRLSGGFDGTVDIRRPILARASPAPCRSRARACRNATCR